MNWNFKQKQFSDVLPSVVSPGERLPALNENTQIIRPTNYVLWTQKIQEVSWNDPKDDGMVQLWFITEEINLIGISRSKWKIVMKPESRGGYKNYIVSHHFQIISNRKKLCLNWMEDFQRLYTK